ncbi:MAG: 4Fe-4S dicluster domain-containing protein [bacterium]
MPQEKAGKALLIYPDLCIACRSCQVACKQWNNLPAESTTNCGSYENPAGLSFHTYTRIHFQERKTTRGIQWLFLKQQCYHCTDAACMLVCPSPGAISRTDEGAVILNPDKCIGCKYCVQMCPFGSIQFDPVTRKVSKCHLCHDRITMGAQPACSLACPTGAVRYGDRKALIQQARLLGYQTIYGEKEVKGLHVLFALHAPAQDYGLPPNPRVPVAVFWWKRIFRPLLGGGSGIALLGILVHFFQRTIRSHGQHGDPES